MTLTLTLEQMQALSRVADAGIRAMGLAAILPPHGQPLVDAVAAMQAAAEKLTEAKNGDAHTDD